jgi:hypothetical protein
MNRILACMYILLSSHWLTRVFHPLSISDVKKIKMLTSRRTSMLSDRITSLTHHMNVVDPCLTSEIDVSEENIGSYRPVLFALSILSIALSTSILLPWKCTTVLDSCQKGKNFLLPG